MSLVKLANGQKFEIEAPVGLREGVLRQRERKILLLVFRAGEADFAEIRAAFADGANVETVTLYYPDEKPDADDEQLAGVAHEVFVGFTVPGEVKEMEVMLEAGSPTRPPVYGRQLSIDLGQRQYGE